MQCQSTAATAQWNLNYIVVGAMYPFLCALRAWDFEIASGL